MSLRQQVFESSDGLTVHMTRNGLGIIQSVDESIFALLGWHPAQMIGVSSTHFIHSEDQAAAVAAWVKMTDSPDRSGVWRGRYQSGYGTWIWVETLNRYEDGESPIVTTSMTRVTTEQISTEEKLHARGQLLSRLSDALPVGVFQMSLSGHVTFTNDRLHTIVGVGPRATIQEQMAMIVPEDQLVFDAALAATLSDTPVDDLEIRLRLPADAGGGDDETEERVCLLGLRTLSDSSGVVSGAVGCLSDVTERAQLLQELEVRASTDVLTSCLNRAATLELVGRTVAGPDPSVGNAIVFIDLDQFKSVNDDLGHAAGDRLLIEAAHQIGTAIREGDRLGRFGGDEFLVVCPGVDSPMQAAEIAKRIAGALTSSVDVGPCSVRLRASVGVAWTSDALDPDALIARADSAMYESKRLGRQGVTLCNASSDSVHAIAV